MFDEFFCSSDTQKGRKRHKFYQLMSVSSNNTQRILLVKLENPVSEKKKKKDNYTWILKQEDPEQFERKDLY